MGNLLSKWTRKQTFHYNIKSLYEILPQSFLGCHMHEFLHLPARIGPIFRLVTTENKTMFALFLLMKSCNLFELTSTAIKLALISLPQIRLPSTEPTITMPEIKDFWPLLKKNHKDAIDTVPSSYTIQIFVPSLFHAMSVTTDLFLLFIISSYHEPLKMNPFSIRITVMIFFWLGEKNHPKTSCATTKVTKLCNIWL